MQMRMKSKELLPLQGKVPDAVMTHLRYCIDVLDEAYGADREYLHSGGYCLLAETKDDLPGICEIMDLDSYAAFFALIRGQYRY